MHKHLYFILLLSFLLIGCAGTPQSSLTLNKTALLNTSNRIGVVMAKVPAPSMSYPGADCLLCLAAAATANSSLSKYVKSFSIDELTALKKTVADTLRDQGYEVVVIAKDIVVKDLPKSKNKEANVAKYDHSSLRDKHNITQVLVIDIHAVGATRSYAAYIPTGDPRVSIIGKTYLVDLQSNMYQWYLPLNIKQSAAGPWKEPPEYPALTNAYYTSLERIRDSILKPLSSH